MRISDWSSDVCSSDLPHLVAHDLRHAALAETVEDQQGTIADALHQHVAAVGVALDLAEPATPARRLIGAAAAVERSEEHTSELQSLMRISYAVFCLKQKNNITPHTTNMHIHTHNIHSEIK